MKTFGYLMPHSLNNIQNNRKYHARQSSRTSTIISVEVKCPLKQLILWWSPQRQCRSQDQFTESVWAFQRFIKPFIGNIVVGIESNFHYPGISMAALTPIFLFNSNTWPMQGPLLPAKKNKHLNTHLYNKPVTVDLKFGVELYFLW